MDSQENIRSRLESLFAGIKEAIPRTGTLSPDPLGQPGSSQAQGWIWETDNDGTYTWCSPEVEIFLGISPDDILGKKIDEVAFEEGEMLRAAITSGDEIESLLLGAIDIEGRKLTILIHGMRRASPSGEILGYRGVAQVIESEAPQAGRMTMEIPLPPDQIDATSVPALAPTWGTIIGYSDDGVDIKPISMPPDMDILETDPPSHRMVIPLQVQDQIIGVLEIDEKEDGESWSTEDLELAESVAHEFALALQDTRSFQLTEQALDEMREADRLKSQFLANMSHELRTPLNSIIGFSRVILKGIDGPITENQEEDLTAIYNAGQHLLGLINDILDVSKIDAGKMELAFTEVDLAEIIRGAMSTAVGYVKDKPIELIIDIPTDLPKVQGDNIRIRQVLINLVSNAAKFTEEGHVGVSARAIERGDRHEVVIAVFDTGPGIEPEDQQKIFEPFSQVDDSPTRKTGGTGLGLSICRHLVELHGGQIWVESMPDQGSTFAFTLPYQPSDEEE